MARWLWDNLRTLLLSFILAVLVWVVAVNEENPIEEKVFPQPVTIQLLNVPPDLLLMGQPNLQTSVTIRAPSLVWDQLTIDQVRVTADLSAVGPGTYNVPLVGSLSTNAARLTRLEPAAISLTFEKRLARQLPVHLEQTGDVALGYAAGPPVVTPLTTTVTGPASLVNSVSEVRATITLSGLKDDFNDSVALEPADNAGKLVNGVVLSPASAHVQVSVTQKTGFRDVTVSPVIRGQVAYGYRLTNITVSPPVVTVSSSDPRKVNNLPGYIETQPLDITGWQADRAVRLPLAMPAGVSLQGDQAVFVQVSITAIEYSETVPRELQLQGLADGLEATPSPDQVDILISGPLPVLNQLTQEDVSVYLDLTGLDVGTYQLTPQVSLLPTSLHVDKVLTSPIEVDIRIKPTPTETPTASLTPTITLTPTRTRQPPATRPPATATPTPTDTSTPTPSPAP